MRFAQVVAVITGGGSGIGRATAELFAREGARVAILELDKAGGETVADRIRKGGGEAVAFPADVSHRAEVEAAVEATVKRFGGVGILVNSAGVSHVGDLSETPEDAWDRVIGTNLKGTFLCSRAVVPHMLVAGGGVIVNVASVLGLVGTERRVAYCASKGGVVQLTKAMAMDYARRNIRVNALCPGTVLTPMVERAMREEWGPEMGQRRFEERQPTGRMATPEEMAHAILYMASDEAAFMTGSTLVIDGGWTAR